MIKYIYLTLISMFPLIELRGAIIYALIYRLNIVLSCVLCIIANLAIIPVIYIFAKRFLDFLIKIRYTRKIATWILDRGHKTSIKIRNKKYTYVALFLFVGIPLPGTGVWTASLASALLGLSLKKSLIAMFLGCILATIIMLSFKILL